MFQAPLFDNLEEAIADGSWVVASSGVGGSSALGYLRHPLSPWELAGAIGERSRLGPGGPLLLLFGPEDTGLTSDELALADVVVTIPTNPSYPILNLSHAVSILLYELSRSLLVQGHAPYAAGKAWRARPPPRASRSQRERLVGRLHRIAGRIGYRQHKLQRVNVMLRRFIARAGPSQWDYHTLMGLCKRLEYNLDRVDHGRDGSQGE